MIKKKWLRIWKYPEVYFLMLDENFPQIQIQKSEGDKHIS